MKNEYAFIALFEYADEKNVNCSKIFQDALKSFLGVEESIASSAVV